MQKQLFITNANESKEKSDFFRTTNEGKIVKQKQIYDNPVKLRFKISIIALNEVANQRN